MPTEISIVNAILRKLNELPETYARKMHGSAYARGWPDIVGSHRGRALMLEVKRPGKALSKLQAAELKRWAAAGAITGRVTSWEETKEIICQASSA